MRIIDENINYNYETVLKLKTDVEIPKKYIILRYLKAVKPYIVGVFALRDVVTGKLYSTCCCNYKEGDWEWTDSDVYYFEKYNVPLNEEFVSLFYNKTFIENLIKKIKEKEE